MEYNNEFVCMSVCPSVTNFDPNYRVTGSQSNTICSVFLPTKRALALFPTGTYTGIGAGQFDIKMKFAKKGRYSDPHCISNFVFNFQQFWVKQVEHL